MKCPNCKVDLDAYEFFRLSDDINFVVCPKCHYRFNLSVYAKESKRVERDKWPIEFPIMTLCGSTRFKEEFEAAQKEFSLRGFLVISVGCFLHKENDSRIAKNKELLDAVHLGKIDLADVVLIISPNGYIGESTNKEIRYAKEKGKLVVFQSHSFVKR